MCATQIRGEQSEVGLQAGSRRRERDGASAQVSGMRGPGGSDAGANAWASEQGGGGKGVTGGPLEDLNYFYFSNFKQT
jgi:hypothetical protein